MCGFVGDVVGGVVDAIGSVAEFVVDNALPCQQSADQLCEWEYGWNQRLQF